MKTIKNPTTNRTLTTLFSACLLMLVSFGAAQAEDGTTGAGAETSTAIPEATAPAGTENTTVSEDTQGRIKTQTITVKDRFGRIEEQRVQSMYSEIRYVPNGNESGGYNLIEATGSNGTINSEHSTNDDDLKIPSWNLFSW